MSDSSSDRDPLDVLAEEFVARFRAGQRPSLTEYAQRRPDLADQIRELFPTLIEMEQLRPDSANQTGPFTPHASPPAPDRLGDFRILREIGRGGMGVVYEAVQESLGRHVALKVLPPAALDDPRRLERFRREAQAAARLHHTNIVPVFGSGEAGGQHFFAMQFIQGQGLDTVLDEVRRLKSGEVGTNPASEVAVALTTGEFAPPADTDPTSASTGVLSGRFSDAGGPYWAAVARVGAQAADALAHAHEQGVLHRDIKPSNLLLDRHGTLWVTDFGLAKAAGADDLTAAGDVVGTLRYLAPERFEGPGDHRSDLYALGLTLYELLTLRPAFDAGARPQLVEQVLAAAPPPPRSIDPAVPRDLETIVLKATAKDPARRYQSAAELAEDLRRYLDDRPVLARRTSSAEKALRWCRRNPVVASLLAAVLGVFAGGAALSAYFAVKFEEKAADAADKAQKANDEADNARAERDRFHRLLHVSQINQAQAALADNRIPRLAQLLKEATPQKPDEPDLRGWEWHYLDRQLRGRVIAEIAVPYSSVFPENLSITPSGRFLTSRAEGDGQVLEVWDMGTGRRVARLPKAGSLTLGRAALPVPPQEGLPPPVGPTRFALAPNGRFVAAVTADPPEKAGAAPRQRVRLWEVETGAELPGPQGPPPTGPLNLGPGADWITWVEAPVPKKEEQQQNLTLTLVRWDRASGAITRTPLPDNLPNTTAPPPTPPGLKEEDATELGAGREYLTPDGRTQFRVTTHGKGWSKPAPGGKPGEMVQGGATVSYLECWDLTTSPPRPRWKAIRFGQGTWEGTGHHQLNTETVFSPSWTSAAAWDGQEVTVFRLSDGKEQWRAPRSRPGVIFGVSDDGRRVALQEPYLLTILEKGAPPKPRELTFRYAGGWVGLGADGRMVLNAPGDNRLRVLDVAHDPARAVLGDLRRLEVRRPGPKGDALRLDGLGGAVSNPCVVMDADGREVARIEAPPAGSRMFARLVAGDRRLLTVTEEADPAAGRGPDGVPKETVKWALYDLAKPGRPRCVGGGLGSASAASGAPWLVVTTLRGSKKVRRKGAEADEVIPQLRTVLHDALTGKPAHEMAPVPGEEGATSPVFDPAGARYAIVTWPPQDEEDPSRWHGKHTLRLHEAATGRELWSAELGEFGSLRPEVLFGPDGRQVFVWRPEFGPEGRPKATRVWTFRAEDGARGRTMALTSDVPEGGLPEVIGVSAGGRLLVGAGPEMQVWDPETGERIHRLSGNTGIAYWAATTAHDTRLFVLEGDRLHLWDLTSERELLVLPVPQDDAGLGLGDARGVWFDGQRLLIPGMNGVRAFDGSPLGP